MGLAFGTQRPRDSKLPIVVGDVEHAAREAQSFIRAHRADPDTLRQYALTFAKFKAWCDAHGRSALPASEATVSAYVGRLHRANYAPNTIAAVLVALCDRHRLEGLGDSTGPAREALEGYLRTASGPTRGAGRGIVRPATLSDVERLVLSAPQPSDRVKVLRAALHLLRDGITSKVGRLAGFEVTGTTLAHASGRWELTAPDTCHAVAMAVEAAGRRPWRAAFDLSGAASGHETDVAGAAARLRGSIREIRARYRALVGDGDAELDLATADAFTRALVLCDEESLWHLYDRAVFLMGIHLALDMADWEGLLGDHLERVDEGFHVTLRPAVSDPQQRPVTLLLARRARLAACPVRALDEWLDFYRPGPGDPVFPRLAFAKVDRAKPLSPQRVRDRLLRLCARVDMAPLSPGSFRRGFVASAIDAGATDPQIRAVSRSATVTRKAPEYEAVKTVREVAEGVRP